MLLMVPEGEGLTYTAARSDILYLAIIQHTAVTLHGNCKMSFE